MITRNFHMRQGPDPGAKKPVEAPPSPLRRLMARLARRLGLAPKDPPPTG